MALTLPVAKSLIVKGVAADGSTSADGALFDVTTAVGQMSPILTIPTVFDMARNTSHQGTGSLIQNLRFLGAVKPTGEKPLIDAAGAIITANDPRVLDAKDAELLITQITPTAVNDKYRILNWDQNIEGNAQTLTQYMASWVQVRRLRKENQLLKMSATAAKDTQVKVLAATATATTFEKGSHTEILDITTLTAELAYDLFSRATIGFGKIGLDAAKGTLNQGFMHTEGIGDQDMLVYMSKEFRNKLFKFPSLNASTPGFDLFRSADLTKVDNIMISTTNNMPAGVHMLIVSTGMSGSFAHEQVGDGIGGAIVQDPNWSKAKRLDVWDEYAMGIIFPFLIFAAYESGAVRRDTIEIVPTETVKIELFDAAAFKGDVTTLEKEDKAELRTHYSLPSNVANAKLQDAVNEAHKVA